MELAFCRRATSLNTKRTKGVGCFFPRDLTRNLLTEGSQVIWELPWSCCFFFYKKKKKNVCLGELLLISVISTRVRKKGHASGNKKRGRSRGAAASTQLDWIGLQTIDSRKVSLGPRIATWRGRRVCLCLVCLATRQPTRQKKKSRRQKTKTGLACLSLFLSMPGGWQRNKT